MDTGTDLHRLLRRQDGVIGLDQALAVGLTRDAVAYRVATRAWFPAGPRTYQSADHEETPRSRTLAAMLSVGDAATLVGRSAAWWWRLHPTAPARVEIAVPPSCQPRARRGVTVRRRAVEARDRTVLGGVAVMTRAPAVLDACARLGLEEGAHLMDRALLEGRVGLDQLRAVHARSAGRTGAVIGRELLGLAAGGARSEAERVVHRELRGAGTTGWVPNLEIALPGFGVAVGDVVFPRKKVVVEVDGWAYHRDLRAFLRDARRQNALMLDGWIVIRTNWFELRDDPDGFVRNVREALATRAGSGVGTS